jgi:hypothetical protein
MISKKINKVLYVCKCHFKNEMFREDVTNWPDGKPWPSLKKEAMPYLRTVDHVAHATSIIPQLRDEIKQLKDKLQKIESHFGQSQLRILYGKLRGGVHDHGWSQQELDVGHEIRIACGFDGYEVVRKYFPLPSIRSLSNDKQKHPWKKKQHTASATAGKSDRDRDMEQQLQQQPDSGVDSTNSMEQPEQIEQPQQVSEQPEQPEQQPPKVQPQKKRKAQQKQQPEQSKANHNKNVVTINLTTDAAGATRVTCASKEQLDSIIDQINAAKFADFKRKRGMI